MILVYKQGDKFFLGLGSVSILNPHSDPHPFVARWAGRLGFHAKTMKPGAMPSGGSAGGDG